MSDRIERWGFRFPASVTELDSWFWRYAHDKRPVEKGGPSADDKWEALVEIIDLLWNNENSTRRVVWNPWTERMLRAMLDYRYVGLAGCGSSGKSDAAAVFALVEWLAAPTETLCLITSTTISGAKKRVWKSVTELWNSLESEWKRDGKSLPGKMLSSGNDAMIKGVDVNGKFSEALGLGIVAADTSSDQAASKKLKGLKSPAEGRGRLRLIADELPDLGRSVYVSAVGNLNANPDFKCVGLGNPRYKMDPFGELCEPSRPGGYGAVTASDESWDTDLGICIRFDATQSPRITDPNGDKLYPWMPDAQYIKQIAKKFGEDSAEFWSQVKGMWPPDGLSNSIWSEGELLAAQNSEPIHWDNPAMVQRISALDIPYTSGGDRAPFIWAECGKVNGVKKMRILGLKILSEGISEDSFKGEKSDKEEVMSSNLHMIHQYKSLNMELGIKPRFTGFDSTAGGKIFSDWVTADWKPGCRAINFGSKPVDRLTAFNEEEGDYGNRVAQLWCQPKPLVRQGQITGISRELSMELCQRKFSSKATSGKLWIETKDEMKRRTGESPDLADSFVILVEVALLNGLLEFEEVKRVERSELRQWNKLALGSKNPLTQNFSRGNIHPKRLKFK